MMTSNESMQQTKRREKVADDATRMGGGGKWQATRVWGGQHKASGRWTTMTSSKSSWWSKNCFAEILCRGGQAMLPISFVGRFLVVTLIEPSAA